MCSKRILQTQQFLSFRNCWFSCSSEMSSRQCFLNCSLLNHQSFISYSTFFLISSLLLSSSYYELLFFIFQSSPSTVRGGWGELFLETLVLKSCQRRQSCWLECLPGRRNLHLTRKSSIYELLRAPKRNQKISLKLAMTMYLKMLRKWMSLLQKPLQQSSLIYSLRLTNLSFLISMQPTDLKPSNQFLQCSLLMNIMLFRTLFTFFMSLCEIRLLMRMLSCFPSILMSSLKVWSLALSFISSCNLTNWKSLRLSKWFMISEKSWGLASHLDLQQSSSDILNLWVNYSRSLIDQFQLSRLRSRSRGRTQAIPSTLNLSTSIFLGSLAGLSLMNLLDWQGVLGNIMTSLFKQKRTCTLQLLWCRNTPQQSSLFVQPVFPVLEVSARVTFKCSSLNSRLQKQIFWWSVKIIRCQLTITICPRCSAAMLSLVQTASTTISLPKCYLTAMISSNIERRMTQSQSKKLLLFSNRWSPTTLFMKCLLACLDSMSITQIYSVLTQQVSFQSEYIYIVTRSESGVATNKQSRSLFDRTFKHLDFVLSSSLQNLPIYSDSLDYK